jgi:general secretion pathway protein F
MALFLYKAVGSDGNMVEGQSEGVNEQAVAAELQEDGSIPIEIISARTRPLSNLSLRRKNKPKILQKDIATFTKELATLLSAGLPLDRSLALLADLVPEKSPLRNIVLDVLDQIREGTPFSEALESQSGCFSRFYINMIRAGEAGGGLEGVLERLSEYLERSRELRSSVSTALMYPMILVTIAVLSLMMLLTFVVPQFQEMFESAGKELPIPTQVVVALSEFLQDSWWILLVGGFSVYVYIRSQFSNLDTRPAWDQRVLAIPLVKDLITKIEVASLSRTLGTLLGNGVTLMTALSIAKETLSNQVIAQVVEKASHSLQEGGNMSTPLMESNLFPKMALQMIRLGEETGNLETMFNRVAHTYDQEIKITIERMLTMLEPILIVTLGLMIAGIIISILMAMLSVNDLAF